MASTVAAMPSARMSEAEWETRLDLAACYRLVDLFGWSDLVNTRITARVPGQHDHFLINPYGLLFDEVQTQRSGHRFVVKRDFSVLSKGLRAARDRCFIISRIERGLVVVEQCRRPFLSHRTPAICACLGDWPRPKERER
jgi:hypothetical protein